MSLIFLPLYSCCFLPTDQGKNVKFSAQKKPKGSKASMTKQGINQDFVRKCKVESWGTLKASQAVHEN